MKNSSYYREKLSAVRLRRCYEIAPPRIKEYLNAEIEFVASRICDTDVALELGCGYGRVMKEVASQASRIVGIDISKASLELGKLCLGNYPGCELFLMDASCMAFTRNTFDVVFCVQNGVSAFGIDARRLISESMRVTKDNGIILYSSYSPKIWEDRLDWFGKQSELGLLGEIDEEKTGDGTIVCKDGFRATTMDGDRFTKLFREFGLEATLIEIDESSIFCKAKKTEYKHARFERSWDLFWEKRGS